MDFDSELGEYFPSRSFEEKLFNNYINEYNNETFWDELIDRLIDRDIQRNNNEEQFRKMTIEERLEKEEPIRLKYEKEFDENGLDNLSIK